MNEESKLAYAIARQKATYERSGMIGGMISGITYGIMGAIIGGLWYWSFTTVYQYTNVDPGNAACMAATIIAPLVFYTFNDLFAFIYLTIYNVSQGRGKDLIQSLKTKPALIIMVAGIIGGPMGQGFYYLGFPTDAAAFAGPISALYVIFGVLLGRVLLHQVMQKRVWVGIAICVIGAIVIGLTGNALDVGSTFYFGIVCFLIAAIGWGFEGTVAAVGTPMIDPKIAANIRFLTTSIVMICLTVGVFTLFPDTETGLSGVDVFVDTITSGTVLLAMITGLCVSISYICWYRANNLIGVGRGMALNSTYSAWTPLISMLIIMPTSAAGYFAYQAGLGTLPFIAVGCICVLIGVIVVSVDPREFFHRKSVPEDIEEEEVSS